MYSLETGCQNLLTKASFTVFKQLIRFVDDEPLHTATSTKPTVQPSLSGLTAAKLNGRP